jgi:hypothetical protein
MGLANRIEMSVEDGTLPARNEMTGLIGTTVEIPDPQEAPEIYVTVHSRSGVRQT